MSPILIFYHFLLFQIESVAHMISVAATIPFRPFRIGFNSARCFVVRVLALRRLFHIDTFANIDRLLILLMRRDDVG